MAKRYDLAELTPKKTVEELNRYVVGQDEAKKAVAVALRNRYRRAKLPEEMREEVTPKNIILMGPTGVGKTEITRRIAKIVNAPLVKVEATKFTEVGYVGRDVESMIRDLVATSVKQAQQEMMMAVQDEARDSALRQIADSLAGIKRKKKDGGTPLASILPMPKKEQNPAKKEEQEEKVRLRKEKRAQILEQLQNGELGDEMVTVEVEDRAMPGMAMNGMDDMIINVNDMLSGIMPTKMKSRTMKVKDAIRLLTDQEASKLIDQDEAVDLGLRNAEENGIVFIDEIDKIIGPARAGSGPNVSREGVQRDILPIVEGSIVNTKYGPIRTDYILFIGSGAFHSSKVTDLIPELQGRFPITVELDSLTQEDFERILSSTENSLLKQYKALLETEGFTIDFTEDAIHRLAEIAYNENMNSENIGARRLHTVLEKLVEDLAFEIPDLEEKEITIDKDYVDKIFNDKMEETEKSLEQYMI